MDDNNPTQIDSELDPPHCHNHDEPEDQSIAHSKSRLLADMEWRFQPKHLPMDTPSLEHEIVSLCAVLTATEYEFLRLLSEFDRRGGWEGDGTMSCAHWLCWRCGISIGVAREKVRVAHALTKLPKISEAFRKGQLSYSKVRAMTRIATPDLEDSLMVTAQYGSATHIEKLVQSFRRVENLEELEKERKNANQRHYTRRVSHFWDEDGNLVLKATLPPEQGALVLKALEGAAEKLRSDEKFNPFQDVDHVVDGETDTPLEKSPDVPAGTSGSESPNSNDSSKPDPFLDTTERKRVRRADALALVARDWLSLGGGVSKSADRYQVVVNIDLDLLGNKIRPAPIVDQDLVDQDSPDATGHDSETPTRIDQVCAIEEMCALPVDTVRRISCDCSVVGVLMDKMQPLSASHKIRTPAPAMRRAVKRRDNGCTFPGCCATRYVEIHHITHWADDGKTIMKNLTTLCSHHHHLVHEGNYKVIRNDDGVLEFYDPLGRYIAPKQVQPNDIDYRLHVHNLQSMGIDEKSLWSYCGDRMDYDLAIEGLLSARDKKERELARKKLLEESARCAEDSNLQKNNARNPDRVNV